ncbi:MAG: hypothetical protein LBG15_05760 [Dysgonamonadaceae bacterium]|jgi:hypothetical protein|nr:hypothetical protein [Dysgonamonadaceae bacterium]
MKNEYIHDAFLADVRKKIPQNSKLVNMLVDILFIEKEAVYRRLRREVPFTFQEIVFIAKKLGISLDNIIGIGINTDKSRPFQLKLVEYLTPSEIDYSMMDEYVNIFRQIKAEENTEAAVISNILPQTLYSGFDYISKFYIFKWYYLYYNEKARPFHETIVPNKVMNLFTDTFIESKNIQSSYFILDYQLFANLVTDIKYYNSIRLITKEDVLKIKEDLHFFLDYIEEMTISGCFKETGNQVRLYISEVNIETNYSYLLTQKYNLSLIWTFILTTAASLDEDVFQKMKNWFQSFIRTSTLITITGEKQRIVFFEKQREIINEL